MQIEVFADICIARELGVGLPDDADRQQVRVDWDDGKARGLLGSPHFFCGEANVFCPSLAISRQPETGLRIEQDRAKLVAFLQQCLTA